MFVPWLASSEVLGDRESDPERRDVRREPAFSKAFVCKVSGSLFAPTQALWLDRGPLAHGRRQFLCGRLRSQAVLRRQRSGQSGFAPWGPRQSSSRLSQHDGGLGINKCAATAETSTLLKCSGRRPLRVF